MRITIIIFLLVLSTSTQAQNSSKEFENVKSLYKIKEFKSALSEIDNLIKKDSNNVEYFIYKSDIEKELKLYNESIETLDIAVQKFPLNHYAIMSRGILFLNFNYPDEAIKDFNTSLKIATSDSMKRATYVNLGAAKIWKRDFQGAYNDLYSAYKIDSMNLGVLSNLAAVCDEVDKGSETLKYLFKAIAIDSTYIPGYAGIGYKYQELGKHKEAIQYYNKVLDLDPNEALGYSNRSFNKLKLNDLKGAIEDINKSINLYQDNSYAYKIKALILIEKNEIKSACENIEIAINKKYEQTYGNDIIKLKEKYCK